MFGIKKLHTLSDYVIIFAGSLIYATSVNTFTAPNNIAPGGMTGISTMVNYLTGLPIGIMILLLNIPLFLWGAYENGARFLVKTIVATVLVSVIIDVMAPFSYKYYGDTLLASIFGGLVSGLGLSCIFFRGGTTGGTDIIARNIHKRHPHISMGTVILGADIVIIVGAAVVYKSLENALYSVISIFVSTKVIDTVIYGVAHDNGKLMFIVSGKSTEICTEIMSKVGRGVTVIDAHGAYKNDPKKVLMCALRPSQVHRTKLIVSSIDKDAFIVVTTANTINGRGFVSSA